MGKRMIEELLDSTKRFTIICFEITNNCNKNCIYCSRMYEKGREVRNMKIEDYKYVVSCINEKDRQHFRQVIVTGGEPALHPHFLELMKLMRNDFPKAELNIQSNGRILKKLPQRRLRILYSLKNVKFSISYYPGWNDKVKEYYDSNYRFPLLWRRIIRKFTRNNRIVRFIALDYRFPFMKRIRRFMRNPLKLGNAYFKPYTGFWNPFDDPNLSEEDAKAVRKICCYYIYVLGVEFYNCCDSAVYERCYNTESVHIKFDRDWKKKFFKLETWKACVHCRLGYDIYRFNKLEEKLGYKKFTYLNLKRRGKLTRIYNHE